MRTALLLLLYLGGEFAQEFSKPSVTESALSEWAINGDGCFVLHTSQLNCPVPAQKKTGGGTWYTLGGNNSTQHNASFNDSFELAQSGGHHLALKRPMRQKHLAYTLSKRNLVPILLV